MNKHSELRSAKFVCRTSGPSRCRDSEQRCSRKQWLGNSRKTDCAHTGGLVQRIQPRKLFQSGEEDEEKIFISQAILFDVSLSCVLLLSHDDNRASRVVNLQQSVNTCLQKEWRGSLLPDTNSQSPTAHASQSLSQKNYLPSALSIENGTETTVSDNNRIQVQRLRALHHCVCTTKWKQVRNKSFLMVPERVIKKKRANEMTPPRASSARSNIAWTWKYKWEFAVSWNGCLVSFLLQLLAVIVHKVLVVTLLHAAMLLVVRNRDSYCFWHLSLRRKM